MTAFSIDLRQRILDAYDAGEGTRQQIADRFAVSLGFVKRLLAQRKAMGNIAPRPHPGRPPAFSGETLKRLDEFVGQHADATLAEIQERFSQEVQCSIVAVHHTLRRLGYRRKKTLRASEQDRSNVKERRDKWRGEQPFPNSERLVFLDESGAKTNMTRFRGRIKGKARLRVSAPAGHWATATMISSIRLDGKRACMCVDGSTTSYEFAFIHRAPVQREIRGHLRGHEKNANGVP